MSLPPFLREKQQTGVSVQYRKPDSGESDSSGLDACGQDLLRAIENKDFKAIGEALKAAFAICDSEPHNEGEHLNSEEE